MDTDDLTPMAYATLSLGFEACEPLRAEIGATANDFSTEDEFLQGLARFMEEIISGHEDYLDSWDLHDQVDQVVFLEKIRHVQDHIVLTLKTPRTQRGKPPFEN